MKIERAEWWQVDQFVHVEMVNSPEYADVHERWDVVPKVLLRLTTDEGHTGIGETSRGTDPAHVEAACRALLGEDPLALPLRRLPLGDAPTVAYQGVECALFDLVGKARGMRLGDLLGGYHRDEVVSSYWAGLQDPEYSVAAARGALAGGYGCMKIKITQGMDVIGRLARMLEVAPDLRFIVDAMQRYDDLGEMLELCRRLPRYNVVCIEDPLPKDRYDWYRILREEEPTPVALHLGSTRQVVEAIKADAADIFNCAPASLVEFVRMVDVAGAAGKPCWRGSGVELGILDLSFVHACAVADNATIPHDILCEQLHVEDFVVQMPPRTGDRIRVPEGPGLGGELDMEAVARYTKAKGEVR